MFSSLFKNLSKNSNFNNKVKKIFSNANNLLFVREKFVLLQPL